MEKDLLIYGLTSLVAAGITISYYNKPVANEIASQAQSAVVQQSAVAQTSPHGKYVDHNVVGCLNDYLNNQFKDIPELPILIAYNPGIATFAVQGKLLNYASPAQEVTVLMDGIYNRTAQKDPALMTNLLNHNQLDIIFNDSGFTIKTSDDGEYTYNANSVPKETLKYKNCEFVDIVGDGCLTLYSLSKDYPIEYETNVSNVYYAFAKWRHDHSVDIIKDAYNWAINNVKCIAYEKHNSICQK